MITRKYFRSAAAVVLALGLIHGLQRPLHAASSDHQPDREITEQEALSYFRILPPTSRQWPAPAPVEWALLQGTAPNDGPRRGPGVQRGPRGGQRGPGGPARGFNGPVGGRDNEGRPPFPPRLLERLRNMNPGERERVLRNNPRFRELSPERRAQLLERLNYLLEMNDDQRRELDQRLSVFRNLSPDQRRNARRIYEDHWRVLSPNRRMAVLDEFRKLRDMPAEERGKRIASDDYHSQFSAEERALIGELASL